MNYKHDVLVLLAKSFFFFSVLFRFSPLMILKFHNLVLQF